MNRGMQMTAPAANARSDATTSSVASKPGDLDPTPGKRVLYWHDPMVPGQKFDKPGKSPFMDMQLVPVYADGSGDEGKVSISPRVQQKSAVRVEAAKSRQQTATNEAG